MALQNDKKSSLDTKFHVYHFKNGNHGNFDLKINVPIPLEEPFEEYLHRVMSAFELPFYVQEDLQLGLKKFVSDETTRAFDQLAEEDIKSFKDGTLNVDDVVKFWDTAFRSEHVEYAEQAGQSDEELFSVVYHKLVHSPALETILQAEQVFAETARTAAKRRTGKIATLSERQNEDMANAVKNLHSGVTEKEINDLAAKHFEQHSLIDGRLTSELEALHLQQRTEYRAWIMSVMEQITVNSSPLPSPVSAAPEITPLPPLDASSHWPDLEESFTIHLGSQLKQMHNVRILSADVLDFCRIRSPVGGIEPRRLETALALYSTGLSGVVLLSDVGPIGGFSGIVTDFRSVCEETTELHFPSVQDQLQEMRTAVTDAVKWRTEKLKKGPDSDNHSQTKKGVSKNLQPGVIYVTRHSNLSQVHVVFHMVIDDNVKSNEMNSRHAAILGLRNVLKTAANYDVTTLTLPLLLTHEMTEDMTVAWCTRRAELVFKCVKGFMMETAGAGGAELHNLQFLVPRKISPDVFSALASMLPSIFRVSNPLVVKTTPVSPREVSKVT